MPIGGTTVIVVFDQAPRELPFNPRGARLLAAAQQLEVRVGHPVQIQIDAALLPQWRENFENGLASGIEGLIQGLAWLERTHPRIHAWAAPRLVHVACHYDAAARVSTATFDDRRGTLQIDGPALPAVKHSVQANAAPIALVDSEDVVQGVTRSYFGPYLERRFGGVAPERAPEGELAAYWDYIDRRHSGFYRGASGATQLADAPPAVEVEQALRLEARVPPADGELAGKVRRRLVEAAHFFAGVYMRQPGEARSAPPGSPFRRAEAAYSAWLQQNIAVLAESDQVEILRAPIFVVQTGPEADAPLHRRYVEATFPGFDALGYALGVVDRWIAAGHAVPREVSDQRSIFKALVCPDGPSWRVTRPSGGPCPFDLYHYAAAIPAARSRLLHALSARHDRIFTETVFAHLDGADRLEMWRAIEPDPVEWRIATLTIADPEGRGEGEHDHALYDEGLRLWRQHPDRRGVVLYLLTSFEQYSLVRDGLVNWTEHERIFGSRINAGEYASFVSQGPLAISRAAGLWRALDEGFSRVAPLLPLLDAYLVDPGVKERNPAAPERPIRDIASRLCAEHSIGDLALLHGYFVKRARLSPTEERRFGLILDMTSPGRCDAAQGPGGRR